MFRTHLKFFSRVFLKDKFFSVLNILGLALGIAVSILLLLILQNDLTYDRHHIKHERIYRLSGHLQATGIDERLARVARELGPVLQEEFPEVQAVVRANSWNRILIKRQREGEEALGLYEEDVVRTDSNFFELFTHEFIAGNPKTCLKDLNTLVLTESAAKKYFGDEPALDQSLLVGNESYKVTGVIEDVAPNSHLKFDFLLSQLPDRAWAKEEGGGILSEAFWNPDVFLYILFPEGYDTQDFYAKFPSIYDKYFKSFGDRVGGQYTPILEPLASIHFHSDLDADEPQGNIAYLYAFTGIGIFIILLACINYMNLSTAKSVNRAGEIAMKKTLGSGKRSLVLSFLGESIFLSMISMVCAIILVIVVLRATPLNQLIEKNLNPDFLGNPVLLVGSLVITLVIGLISGLYPAFYLPAIPTLKALKGSFRNTRFSHALRKVLITFQFAISIFVVVCTLFMQDQIDFVCDRELGFDKDNVLLLPIQDTLVQRQLTGIKHEFLQHPRITGATTSYNVMGVNVGGNTVMWAESSEGMKQQAFSLMFVGENYLKTMGMELLAGRDFQVGPKADIEDVYIANEAAARLMGWDEPVGKKIKFFHGEKDGQVIGLVKDFNFASLHNPVEPLLIIKAREEGGFLHLRVAGENLPETMAFIREKWSQIDPNHPYEAFFLDERFNEQYRADEVQYKLLSGLSGICIFISLLGLLGLSAFTATQRTKEIGIRKVHGATIPHIIFLLYREVMYLIIAAGVLIVPLAYYLIDGWLENFAYRVPLNYSLFIVVSVLALLAALVTVAFHSLKTARTNPVEVLKYE